MDLNTLISQLSIELENNKQLKDLLYLVQQYSGDEWNKYIEFNDLYYCKNTIYQCDKFEIVLICWNKNQTSNIHDHPDKGCILIVLDNYLIEEFYNLDIKLEKINNINQNEISYIDNTMGYHKIINKDKPTISLHIYNPPNYKCNIIHKLD